MTTGAAPMPQRLIIGGFLFLAGMAFAVAPLPLAVRSAGILLSAYLAFSAAGSAPAYLVALLAPVAGLLVNDRDWLVMLPIIAASNLLAIVGLEFAWRYLALLISPLLHVSPQLFVLTVSDQELFEVNLPWEPEPVRWVGLHALVALAGTLTAIYLDRRRKRATATE